MSFRISAAGARRSALLAAPGRACRLVLLGWLSAAPGWALEPRSGTEPDVLRQPAQATNVVDAFDQSTGFDLHFTLGYQHTWKRAGISRELALEGADARGSIPRFHVADYAEDTSRLDARAELGLYHDLALIVRVPIILSRSATLRGGELPSGALDGAPGEPLFTLPFRSPNRSGVEYLAMGVDWGILNQYREPSEPTLTIGAEGRFSVSEPMHACGPGASDADGRTTQVSCAQPADINRDGVSGQFVTDVGQGRSESLEGNFASQGRRAGVSRGTTGLDLHAAVSRRFQQIEPYLGFGMLLEHPNESSDFGPSRPWQEALGTRAAFSIGAEIMPWEVVEQFQRLSLDLRFTGTYRSAGRDYSELFDALGSSSAPSYRRPNFAGYMGNPDALTRAQFPSVIDPDSERVFTTGITNVQAYGAYALRLMARWQAGRYVHFDLGGGLELTERHVITEGRLCDPDRSSDLAHAGPCLAGEAGAQRPLGTPDPSYRAEVEQPGRRFIVDTASTLDAWVGATVMF
ncbi:MAG TPA: hypothetical protein VG963_26320 [Polyangiaceae bacterium]|nr:hypothetical protein [Polyangiaceae bacterium]